MDSVTQAVFGAAIAGAVAPTGHRGKALLLGAALGTLPDLDVFIDYGGAVENFTYHRGFSHSLFVLVPFSVLLWWLLRKLWAPVREAPWPWLLAIGLALVTHPLLDAHTAYGTQLFWPLGVEPARWATLFIIDPLFTLPLLLAVLIVAIRPRLPWNTSMLRGALTISCIYLAWSWVGQGIVRHKTNQELAQAGLAGAPVFITPTPFNTLLWRVVVLTDSGYIEGFDSLLLNEADLGFTAYPSDWEALDEASEVWAVQRLRWFSGDFIKTEKVGNQLLLSDLRMGQEPFYVFTHRVAERGKTQWKVVPTELIPLAFERRDLLGSLRRIYALSEDQY